MFMNLFRVTNRYLNSKKWNEKFLRIGKEERKGIFLKSSRYWDEENNLIETC